MNEDRILRIVVGAMAALGLVGGSMVLAAGAFETSNKRGGWHTIVQGPEAYAMAAIMFAMSCIAVLWLLQRVNAKPMAIGLAYAGYGCAVAFLVQFLR
jgi:hypothetical protein